MNEKITHLQKYDINKAVWLYHNDEVKTSLYDKCIDKEDLRVNINRLNQFLLNIVWNDGILKNQVSTK